MTAPETRFELPEGLAFVSRRKIRYLDYRGLEDEFKFKLYDHLHSLWRKGQEIHKSEDKSGFPAITIDCGDIHVLTDCLSLESWWRRLPPEQKERLGTEEQ